MHYENLYKTDTDLHDTCGWGGSFGDPGMKCVPRIGTKIFMRLSDTHTHTQTHPHTILHRVHPPTKSRSDKKRNILNPADIVVVALHINYSQPLAQ